MINYGLTSVQWTLSSPDIRYFSTKEQRDAEILNGVLFQNAINFNYADLLNCTIVINDFNPELYNYIAIQKDNDFAYYFITKASYLSANQWQLELVNDVITNYCYGINDDEFKTNLINQAHCDRFEIVSPGLSVQFSTDLNSPIYEQNTYSQTKVVSETSLFGSVETWIEDNVAGWLYFFVDANKEYNFWTRQPDTPRYVKYKPIPAFSRPTHDTNEYNLPVSTGIFCLPILKSNRAIAIGQGNTDVIQQSTVADFIKANPDTSGIYAVQVSNVAPFSTNSINSRSTQFLNLNAQVTNDIMHDGELIFPAYSITDTNNLYAIPIKESNNILKYVFMCGELFIYNQTSNFSVGLQHSFTRAELKGARNSKFEPKIFALNEICISCSNGDSHTYNALKLMLCDKIYKTEVVEPTGSEIYISIGSGSAYGDYVKATWDGLRTSYNAGLNLNSSYLAQYINQTANARSTALSNAQLRAIISVVGVTLMSIPITAAITAPGVSSGSYAAAKKIIGAGIASGAGRIIDTAANRVAQISNLKASQNAIIEDTKAKGSSLTMQSNGMNLMLTVQGGFKFKRLIKKPDEYIIKSLYDNIYMFGYELNRVDNISKYINTRHYFNYIRCEIAWINRQIPPLLYSRIVELFHNGIRFWNTTDMYNYSKENYEVWL